MINRLGRGVIGVPLALVAAISLVYGATDHLGAQLLRALRRRWLLESSSRAGQPHDGIRSRRLVQVHHSRGWETSTVKRRRVIESQDLTGSLIDTGPWPGPGDSEGPVDTESWIAPGNGERSGTQVPLESEAIAFTTAPWPGPGDSEG